MYNTYGVMYADIHELEDHKVARTCVSTGLRTEMDEIPQTWCGYYDFGAPNNVIYLTRDLEMRFRWFSPNFEWLKRITIGKYCTQLLLILMLFSKQLIFVHVLPRVLLSAWSGGNQNSSNDKNAKKTADRVRIYVENINFLRRSTRKSRRANCAGPLGGIMMRSAL